MTARPGSSPARRGVRTRMGDRRARARRQRRRDRARHRPRLDDLVARTATSAAAAARRHRPRRGVRRRAGGPRALRPARRRRQQRGLRPVRHGRGDQRGRGARADGDQPVRRAVGHPGGAAVPAGAGFAATSCRCRRSAGSARSRTSACTTRRSGRWRASASRWPRRSPTSASRSRSSSRAATRPTGAARRRKHADPLPAYDEYREKAARRAPGADRHAGRPGRHPRRRC